MGGPAARYDDLVLDLVFVIAAAAIFAALAAYIRFCERLGGRDGGGAEERR